jgi:hypothetical protein
LIDADLLLLASTILLAVPTAYAALRVLVARWRDRRARRLTASLAGRKPEDVQAVEMRIARLRSQANDAIKFAGLVPTWAAVAILLSVVLTVAARAMIWMEPGATLDAAPLLSLTSDVDHP